MWVGSHTRALRKQTKACRDGVEVVDKGFFIYTSITSLQLLPQCLGYPESMQFHFIKSTVADFLYFHASERVLDTFVASCLTPGDATLRAHAVDAYANQRSEASSAFSKMDASPLKR